MIAKRINRLFLATSEYFIRLLSEASKKYDHKALLYCLMSNHANLVIHVYDPALSEIVKNISYATTIIYRFVGNARNT